MSRMFEGARRTIASLAQWAEESRMVGRELWEELHRARTVDGVSVSALARRFGLDRKTVRRCLAQPAWRPYRRVAKTDTRLAEHAGYLPIERQGANLFFQLISRRYERGPMITSKQSFGAWGDVFGDRVIATAILDRVLHHAVTVNIRGNSYRLKDKLKSGLVRAEEPAAIT